MPQKYDVIIVGAGLSGLSTAHFLRKIAPHLKVILLEGSNRPGGAVKSMQQDGYLAEWGPHGFLDNNAASRELLADTGLDRLAQKAPLGNFVRYVCHHGKLTQLPQKPPTLLSTPLLSPLGKLRLLGDLLKKPILQDQTIGDWAAYRFGREVLPLVDAAVTGTFAGDYQRLSIDAVMPGVRLLEKENGSVLRGLLRKKKKKTTGPGPTLPAMTSFPNGMEQLITTLAEPADISYGAKVDTISNQGGNWQAQTAAGRLEAKTLVIALPINHSLQLLGRFAPPTAAIPTARIATVAMGFDAAQARIPYGFGYLAPERENRFTLGALFSTHMFPGRAPKGRVMLEALVGGRRHPERLEHDDDQLVDLIYNDLSQLIPLPERPCFTKVMRTSHAIPQLEMSYPALLKWRHRVETENSGLSICGFGWEGIGMNEMMKVASEVAEKIVNNNKNEQQPEVKPVYF
ncbi:MAG: protoporphyrinogen oxidase [Desulfobulbaceae bacterium]|nr:protoporphyrinogen oxidase [Desulfobulbaceae bacterium]HIJ79456.1 protoporphyrinogen oxidase [Deltaproteobacteria bacterium]